MMKLYRRSLALIVLACCFCASAMAQSEPMASVEQLKSEAFRALRAGQFDRTTQLLSRAASLSTDPGITQLSRWVSQFESQRQIFAAQRRKEYDKAVADVQLLLQHKHSDYAIDAAARACLLSDDKKVFLAEPWVKDIVKSSTELAAQYEASNQWIKAVRLYSNLGMIEASKPLWKDKLKNTARRIRLQAMYTPEDFKVLQDAETKAREEVDALIKPTTRPTTKPAELDDKPDFSIDWRDTLRGVKYDMLWDALVDARANYYRETSYKTLLVGGFNGLKTLLTTKGLEKPFPDLADAGKRKEFVDLLDDGLRGADQLTPATEQTALRDALIRIRHVNRRTVQLPEEVLVNEFADGALGELDPFTAMIWPSDLEEFRKTTEGEFSGIGVQIQSDDDGSLKVVSPLEDTPAYKAGIKAGDIITRINGKSAKGITTSQAVKQITGPSGTSVILTVRSPDATVREYTIKRETIKVISVKGYNHKPGGGWDYFIDPEQKIAYLRMTNFSKDTGDELEQAVKDLQKLGARAIILDLRYNPGGLLQAATDVSDKFLSKGVIVSTHPDRDTPNQATVATAHSEDGDCTLPLVVMVNQYSASASEIVSGALKDQSRAILVGERTFGKGSVQMLFPVGSRSACLKLTTSHYYLPSGRCIHREENSQEWGVDPDISVVLTPEQMRAAIDARQEMDILRDAGGEQPATAPAVEKEKKSLLDQDPQLSAALLVLRLQLAGAKS